MTATRRQFIQGAAALPLVLSPFRHADAATPLVRYDCASPQGLAMLEVLATAVRQMQQQPETSPLGWLWQWYTHFVNGATTKSSEIARLFGSASSSGGRLAQDTWNTCQAHSGQDYRNFLPWHRMFVYFFERIVRQASGRADFALPYWDYTSDDPLKRGILPLQFRMPNDPVFGVLYRPDRTSLANSGQRIDANMTSDGMDIRSVMSAATYSAVGTQPGVCRAIINGIHGRIHTLVGTRLNMGSVPYAGKDPLFWVHHSNIDRMWSSWNRNGGVNPTTESWATARFTFVDANGKGAKHRLNEFFDATVLGSTYDAFIPPPAGTSSLRSATVAGAATPAVERVAAARGGTDLGAGPARVPLLPVPGTRRTAVLGLDPAAPGKRTYLVLRQLHTWAQPEVVYEVYLTGRGGRPDRGDLAGVIHFFDAEFHDHGGGVMADVLGDNPFAFDVTELLRRHARSGDASARDSLLVTLVPAGTPNGGQPMVGVIELLRQ